MIVLLFTLFIFLIFKSIFSTGSLSFLPNLVLIAIFIEIVYFVTIEVKEGTKNNGLKHEAIDTLIALGVALILWYGSGFILNTNSPISAVVSCSMLPNLDRGDFVIVQGTNEIKAHTIDLSQSELESLTQNPSINYLGKNITIQGSIFAFCALDKSIGANSEVCSVFQKNPQEIIENKGVFQYRYEKCPITINKNEYTQPCLKSVTYRGNEYLTNFSNDIIVYSPKANEPYSAFGDIVHRAMFKINSEGKTYYLTRGDNNPILDLQTYDYSKGTFNSPIESQQNKGKVILRIPYLGYFKLVVSGFFNEPEQCRTQLKFDHTN